MKKTQTMMVALIFCLALTASAYAQNMHSMGDRNTPGPTGDNTAFRDCPMMGGACGIALRQLMRLSLTDAQKAEVAAVMEKYGSDQQALMDRLAAARQACADDRQMDAAFDEEAIRRAHQRTSAVKEDMAVLRGRILADLKPILTEKQFTSLSCAPSGPKGKSEPFKGRMRPGCPMMDAWQDSLPADAN